MVAPAVRTYLSRPGVGEVDLHEFLTDKAASFLAGAIAGLGGLNYVLGYKHYYEEGFAGGSGFLGIAVALVGRNHPFGVVLAALLFATISQGGLAVNALVPKQFVEVLQAVVIIAVAVSVPEVRRVLRTSDAGRK